MFKFKKSKPNATPAKPESDTQTHKASTEQATTPPPSPQPKNTTAQPPSKSLFKRLSQGLSKTRGKLAEGVANTLLGKRELNDDLLEELETILLSADVGLEATAYYLKTLADRLSRKQFDRDDMIFNTLKDIMTESLALAEKPLTIQTDQKPHVIMMIGVNGSGKTTTTGKLTKHLQQQGHSVMLAAADTFRAAAIEQLQIWGERNQVPVVAATSGGDSAAVCFDALQSAQAKNIDVLVADTAGRLHTQSHLMEELKKIKRVMQKIDPNAPHEIMLVLDASIGQNALQQAKLFHEAVGVTQLCMTKLDGTAKGGIVFAIVKELELPISFIGVGEKIEDLQAFNARDFVHALFDQGKTAH